MKKRRLAIIHTAALAVICTACSMLDFKEKEPQENAGDDMITERGHPVRG